MTVVLFFVATIENTGVSPHVLSSPTTIRLVISYLSALPFPELLCSSLVIQKKLHGHFNLQATPKHNRDEMKVDRTQSFSIKPLKLYKSVNPQKGLSTVVRSFGQLTNTGRNAEISADEVKNNRHE